MRTKTSRSTAFPPASIPATDRALPGNLDRLGLDALPNHDGARIEFFLKSGGHHVCGFGNLSVSQDEDGEWEFRIHRLSSFRNGGFEEQEFELAPSLARWIRFHREPAVATLSLYES